MDQNLNLYTNASYRIGLSGFGTDLLRYPSPPAVHDSLCSHFVTFPKVFTYMHSTILLYVQYPKTEEKLKIINRDQTSLDLDFQADLNDFVGDMTSGAHSAELPRDSSMTA
jgi:hypothetical protein